MKINLEEIIETQKTTRPKALIIVNRMNIGGISSHVSYLARYLQPDFETRLLCGNIDENEGSSLYMAEELGVDVQLIPSMYRSIHPINDRKAYLQIKKIIQEFKPDVVHTHAAKPGLLGRLAAAACKVPVILHTFHGHVFHSYFGATKTRIFLELERYVAKKSSAIIAISKAQKEELGQTYRLCAAEKIKIVPLGFDLEKFTQSLPEKRNQFRKHWALEENTIAIGMVGRLVPIKNIPLFLRAIQLVKQQSKQRIKAFLVGDGEERPQLETLAQELGLSFSDQSGEGGAGADLIFTSWVKEVEEVYAGLDIVALTSLNEGTPVSLIEAQAAGLPIVSVRVGGVENIVLENKSALLSPLKEEATFQQQLLRLVDDPSLRSAMQGQAQAFVQDKFSRKRMVNDLKRLYGDLLSKSVV